MILHVGLMQWMVDVTTGSGEVVEVHHSHEVKIPFEVSGVIAPSHCH
jgi:hypothetical protein